MLVYIVLVYFVLVTYFVLLQHYNSILCVSIHVSKENAAGAILLF